MKILIADDDESSRLLLKRSLEKMGHEVIETSNGKDALGILFKGGMPQLLFLDWMMPELTGLQVCQKIRERQDLPFFYIVLITSRSDREDIITGLRAGANDYITKPLRSQEFQARLQVGIQMIELNNLVVAQRLKLIAHAKMATLGEMANGIAHEINNPLAIISGHFSKLIDSFRPPASPFDVESALDSCERGIVTVKRIARIIEALRAYASDGENEPFQSTLAKELIETMFSFSAEKIRNHGVSVDFHMNREDLRFEVQRSQICQVLLNLLDNSFLAAKEQSKKWIKVELFDDTNNILIAITDSGPGIPEAIRAKIMQPFFTTRGIKQGNGLGLSVSKGIVEAHRGELILDESSPFTRFVISIPKTHGDS